MFRIGKLSYIAGMAGEIRDFYFNSAWQCLEERVEPSSASSSSGASQPTTDRQFVWGLRYIDDLILRDRDATSDGTLDERLYAAQDPNWNVVLLTEDDGTEVERYSYCAFGTRGILTPGFVERSSSLRNPDYTYAGLREDRETRMLHARYRQYYPTAGIWLSRDPWRQSVPDSGLYTYVSNRPLSWVDPYGLIGFNPPVAPFGGLGEWHVDRFMPHLRRDPEGPFRDSNSVLGEMRRGCVGLASIRAGLADPNPPAGPLITQIPQIRCFVNYKAAVEVLRSHWQAGRNSMLFAIQSTTPPLSNEQVIARGLDPAKLPDPWEVFPGAINASWPGMNFATLMQGSIAKGPNFYFWEYMNHGFSTSAEQRDTATVFHCQKLPSPKNFPYTTYCVLPTCGHFHGFSGTPVGYAFVPPLVPASVYLNKGETPPWRAGQPVPAQPLRSHP
ncbi:MAG: hypothetical protein HQ582_06165 [Planctomycetes bacterium]|nr:hypothetical protein [Planctomycetota bacterium]